MELHSRAWEMNRQIAREKYEQESIAWAKKRGEGGYVSHCGRYLGVLHLNVVDDVWTAKWSEVPEDSLADY